MLIVATTTVVAAAPLELLALGLGGLAVVVAVGSAIVTYGNRRALALLDEPEEVAPE